jgi:hypothetical protein
MDVIIPSTLAMLMFRHQKNMQGEPVLTGSVELVD